MMKRTRFSLLLLSVLALVVAASLVPTAMAEQTDTGAEPGPEQADRTLESNLLREPMLDDSRWTTAEEERAQRLPQRSSAGQLGSDLVVNGLPVLLANPPLVIHAAAFVPDGAIPDSTFFPFGGGYVVGDSQNYGCMVAQADLPGGVTLVEMFATVWDNDTTRNLSVSLRRVDNFSGGTETMAIASTTGDFAGVQVVSDQSITFPLIVYPAYSYYLTVCLASADLRLYSVRLYWG